MKTQKETFDIIFFARAGQGAKSTAEILAQAALLEGKYVQAFPSFGPERSGAPIQTYLRVGHAQIRTREPITDPDMVVVLDETILDSAVVTNNLTKDEFLVVNTRRSAKEIQTQINFSGKVFPVDADGISMDIIGQPRPNTVILGKLAKIADVAKLGSVTEQFRNIFGEKLGPEMTGKNIQAIEKAYDLI